MKFLGVTIVIGNGRLELCLSDAILLKDGIDVVLCLFFPFVSGKFIDDSLHEVVVIQHILHFST